MHRSIRTRLALAVSAALLTLALGASAAFAGEITGNGKLLHPENSKWGTGLHARSFCAYSGQEDLQFFEDDEQQVRKEVATKGSPTHAQSWGQIPKADRDFLATIGLHPGNACNPNGEFSE